MNDAQQTMFFTDKAASKVRVMVAEQAGSDDLLLRVYIEGGGCSGFQYGFEFDSTIEEDDTVVENGDVKLVVDPLSINTSRVEPSTTKKTCRGLDLLSTTRTRVQRADAVLHSRSRRGNNDSLPG